MASWTAASAPEPPSTQPQPTRAPPQPQTPPHPDPRAERMEFIPLKEVAVKPVDERLRKLGGERTRPACFWGCGRAMQPQGPTDWAWAGRAYDPRVVHGPPGPGMLSRLLRTRPVPSLLIDRSSSPSMCACHSPHTLSPWPVSSLLIGTAKLALDLVEFDAAYEKAFVFACGWVPYQDQPVAMPLLIAPAAMSCCVCVPRVLPVAEGPCGAALGGWLAVLSTPGPVHAQQSEARSPSPYTPAARAAATRSCATPTRRRAGWRRAASAATRWDARPRLRRSACYVGQSRTARSMPGNVACQAVPSSAARSGCAPPTPGQARALFSSQMPPPCAPPLRLCLWRAHSSSPTVPSRAAAAATSTRARAGAAPARRGQAFGPR
jgi:hypothetical protein